MTAQFKEGVEYSGEVLYGGCGSINNNSIVVLKRDGNNITFKEYFGNTEGSTLTLPIETIEGWGEYVSVRDDRFFAYALEDEQPHAIKVA